MSSTTKKDFIEEFNCQREGYVQRVHDIGQRNCLVSYKNELLDKGILLKNAPEIIKLEEQIEFYNMKIAENPHVKDVDCCVIM